MKTIISVGGQVRLGQVGWWGWVVRSGGTLGSDVILNSVNFGRFFIADCACRFRTNPLMMMVMISGDILIYLKETFLKLKKLTKLEPIFNK